MNTQLPNDLALKEIEFLSLYPEVDVEDLNNLMRLAYIKGCINGKMGALDAMEKQETRHKKLFDELIDKVRKMLTEGM